MTRRKQNIGGRKAGSHNQGFWHRKGRGWYVTDGDKSIPLCDKAGDHIKEENTPSEQLKDAYARYRLARGETQQLKAIGDDALIFKLCDDYLKYVQTNQRRSTFHKRGEFLYDLCFGLPCRFWDYGGTRQPKHKPTPDDKLHDGYGKVRVSEFLPHHLQQWLDFHKGWGKGTRSMAIQALKRAFNYSVEMKVISSSPIKGFKAPKGGTRVTFFTPEQEQAMIENSKKPLALAIRILIRTGVRPYSEFLALTPKHVEETKNGMVWHFTADEAKTHKERIVYVPADIAEIVREKMKGCQPNERIFKNTRGQDWSKYGVKSAFDRLKERLTKKGIKLDDDACPYSCRHTFAKRVLGGYWTGQPATIEQVSALMGNSREVCWQHYAKWCQAYTDPVWQALERK